MFVYPLYLSPLALPDILIHLIIDIPSRNIFHAHKGSQVGDTAPGALPACQCTVAETLLYPHQGAFKRPYSRTSIHRLAEWPPWHPHPPTFIRIEKLATASSPAQHPALLQTKSSNWGSRRKEHRCIKIYIWMAYKAKTLSTTKLTVSSRHRAHHIITTNDELYSAR